MKSTFFMLLCVICTTILVASQTNILIHNYGTVIKKSAISCMDSMKFQDMFSVMNFSDNTTFSFPIDHIDSITFSQETDEDGNIVYITYDETSVSVINPFSNNGVTISIQGANVTVNATIEQKIHYYITGTTSNGGLVFNSTYPITLTMNEANITNNTSAAININSKINTDVILIGTSVLADNLSSTVNATFFSKGALNFEGDGSLFVSGNYKHGIGSSNSYVNIIGGNISITSATTDGIHAEGFIMSGGNFTSTNIQGDAIDAGATDISIYDGNITSTVAANDQKGLKTDASMYIYNGTITMLLSGEGTKGISSKGNVVIEGGTIALTTTGGVYLEASGSGYNPSYCVGIKSDGQVTINNGNISINNSTTTLSGGKGISADGDITINGGNINVECKSGGTTYVNENGIKDSFTACGIKSDANIYLNAGIVVCSSSGIGGKGISADGNVTIGQVVASNTDLTLSINTSGERFLVSGSGNSGDYANPKGIKSTGNLTINSGTINVICSQTTEGGEGIESKKILTINGGNVNVKAYDDCMNASSHLEITGGNIYCYSSGNDAIDSNGTMTISGGFIISSGTRAPEEGFDCDNNTFTINGGTLIGSGGATSNPTTTTSKQNSIKYTGTAGSAIRIKNSSGTVILTFLLPSFPSATSTGFGGPGGGSNSSMIVLFSDLALTNGSYTLQYGGTISGGSNTNGYYTGATYTGGSSKTFTISSKLTTVQ
jgi:hypothetical protein